jgi:hypothetical protein
MLMLPHDGNIVLMVVVEEGAPCDGSMVDRVKVGFFKYVEFQKTSTCCVFSRLMNFDFQKYSSMCDRQSRQQHQQRQENKRTIVDSTKGYYVAASFCKGTSHHTTTGQGQDTTQQPPLLKERTSSTSFFL